jgi:hypothetical protein
MTKEEVLRKHYNGFDTESGWMFDGAVSDVFEAMDEYEKQQVIACLKWIANQEGEMKLCLNDNNWYWDADVDGAAPLSEEELYKIFHQRTTNTDTK